MGVYRIMLGLLVLLLVIYLFTQMILPVFVPNMRLFWWHRKDQKQVNNLEDELLHAQKERRSTELRAEIDRTRLSTSISDARDRAVVGRKAKKEARATSEINAETDSI